METIVPSPSATIGQVARFIQLLERHGVAGNEIQRFIDDIELRNQVVSLMRPMEHLLDLSGEFNLKGLTRLVNHYWPNLKSLEEIAAQGYGSFEGGNTRETLTTTKVARDLIEGLGSLQSAVFVLRLGLLSGRTASVQEVSEQLNIPTNDVNTLRTEANRHVEALAQKYQLKLVFPPNTPILALLRVPKGYQFSELHSMPLEDLEPLGRQKRSDYSVTQEIRRFVEFRRMELKWPFGDFTIESVIPHSGDELTGYGWTDRDLSSLKMLLNRYGFELSGQ